MVSSNNTFNNSRAASTNREILCSCSSWKVNFVTWVSLALCSHFMCWPFFCVSPIDNGRWILQDDYLKDSADAGVFLDEKKYEWYGSGMTEDGSICLEAPRKWREQRENSGCCALEGLRILLYGECIIPSLVSLVQGCTVLSWFLLISSCRART